MRRALRRFFEFADVALPHLADRVMLDFVKDAFEAVEAGHDHDADPLVVQGRYTGVPLDVGFFSRNRAINPNSSMSVHG